MSYSTILHKRSLIPNIVPSLTSLSAGEIAINTADGKLFTKTVGNAIETFLNASQQPYTLNQDLSSVGVQYGGNIVTGILAGVLGGIENDVSGAGSTVVNGSDNDIEGDYAFIGNGSNNKILSGGDFGAILGGLNNTLDHQESFILGSNITSHLSGVTYVNNISATGKLYGDGSELTGIVAGGGGGSDVSGLSANWENTYTTVQEYSASWGLINVDDPLKFVFTSNGSQTSYSINGTGDSDNASLIEVFVDNVRQEPEVSYTLSAEEIEFADTPALSARIVVITPNSTVIPNGDITNVNDIITIVQSNSASWGGGGASGTKTYSVFTPRDNQPPSTNFATLDTRNSIAVLDFDAATDESAVFVGVVPEGADLSSGLKVNIFWMATSATSNNVRWGVQFEKSNTDLDSDSFDTAQEVTSTANGTAGIPIIAEITTTTIDSLTAGDLYRLKVFRNADDATNDTMSGDAELIAVEIRSAS